MANHLKIVSAVLLVAAVTVLLTGSVGVSSVEADREITIEVVDDEDAYVGFIPDGESETDDGNLVVAEIRNQLPTGTELTITDSEVTTSDDSEINTTVEPETLGPGEATNLTIDACSGDNESIEVSVAVDASSDSVDIHLANNSRTFEVSCT